MTEPVQNCSAASESAVVSIQPMALSDGRTDYFVQIKIGERAVTPHVFREEFKAAYHVALYDWLLNGAGEEPDCVEFGPDDWPARVMPAVAQAPLEPVAWQVFDKNAGWLHIPDSLADSYRKEGEKVRPLYAHPPFSAKQNLQELLEESRAALARIDAAPPPAAPIETDWFDECSKQAGRAFHYWSVLDRIKDRLGGPADAQLYDIRQLVETALAAQHPAAPVQCSSAGNVEVPTDALINLVNYQEQCDEDGVMVKVSRQALAEVLVYVQLVRPDLNGEPQAVPTREDRLETERNALQNSYGGGAFKDGMITLRIAEIDKELVALALSRPGRAAP